MAATTWAEYLVQLNTGIAIPKGTVAHGRKILLGDKIMSMGPTGINAITVSDHYELLPYTGTNVEEEIAWLTARGAPAGTLADKRQYLVINSLMP